MSERINVKRVNLGSAIVAAVITLILGFLIGLFGENLFAGFLPYLGFSRSSNQDWSALNEVYDKLALYYDGDIDKTALIEGAKKGMAAALGDTYTIYMDKEEAEEYEALLHGDAGSGIGVEMALREGYVRIIRTLPDNPAIKAGILAGDIIYKINGEEVWDRTTDYIASKLRGDANTEVELTIVRDGEEKTFTLTREPINNVSAYIDYDGSTAIITVTRFDNDTGKLVQNLVKSSEFKSKNIQKIILDLRSNTGGYVSAAKDLLSLWLDGELILIQKGKSADSEMTYSNRNQAILADIPTIVLVNGTTASASEIVAGALKDYNKATLVGETTFGKGVVQTLLNLSGSTLLKVTTARWYTPSGTSINGEGIKPDEEVEITYEQINHGEDPQLDAAKKL